MNGNSCFLWPCIMAILLTVSDVHGQSSIKLSGSIFSDYYYTLSSPNDEMSGDNGFDFRRVYLTSDYVVSERFDGRVRFEASVNTVDNDGKPSAFVKDLYVRYKNAFGNGHHVMFGLSPPPMWTVSERLWSYRGLEKTIMDRGKIASSRDMGILVSGPVTADAKVKYGAMFANNSGLKAETDKFKRLYGQLEFYPTESFQFTIGGDYYQFEGGSSFSGNAFLGYTSTEFQVGAEGFLNPKSIDSSDEKDTRTGVSLFGFYSVNATQRAIARFDLLGRDIRGAETQNNWIILGYGYRPEKGMEIIPNLIFDKEDSNDAATVSGRLTILAAF